MPGQNYWTEAMNRPDNPADSVMKMFPGGGALDWLGRAFGAGGAALSGALGWGRPGQPGPGQPGSAGQGGTSAGVGPGAAGNGATDGTGGTNVLGTGVYQASGYGVDPNAFNIPGYAGFQQQLAAGAAGAPNRVLSGDMRGMQMGLAQALQAQANGQGPSLAQAQLQAGTDRNLAQAYAMAAAGAGGMGAPGVARNLAYQRGAISQDMAGQAAQLRLQEQLQARNQLGQVLAGARGQDLDTQALNDRLTQFYLQQGMGLAQAQQQAWAAQQQMQGNFNLQAQGINAGAYNNQQGRQGGFNTQLAGAAGQGLSYLGSQGGGGGGGGGGLWGFLGGSGGGDTGGGLTEASPMTY